MGAILNVGIMENGKILANSYYHWSCYTSSALELTKGILDNLNVASYEDKIVNAIKLLETTGSGLTEEELAYAKLNLKDFDKYEFKECTDRNDGLTAISPEGIKQTERWEEKRVTIDLTSKTVNFGAVWNYNSKEHYKEDYEKDCKYPLHDCLNLKEIPFDEFKKVKEFIFKLIDESIYGFQTPDNKFISFIE